MKQYISLGIATVLLATAAYTLPGWMVDRIQQVELTVPVEREFSQDIPVSGIVEERSSREITVPFPVVVGDVWVSVGDRVEANQLIATVDTVGTRTALLNLVQSIGTIPEEYLQYAAMLEQLAAEYDLDSIAKGLTEETLAGLIPAEIRAPASGVVTTLSLTAGGMASYGETLGTISELEGLRIRMSVGEADADRVQEGDTVVFRATATGGTQYAGSIERVFPAATQTISGLSQQTVVGLYVTPEGDTDRLKPGYSVTGVVRKGEGVSALILPYEAILQDDQNREYVYVYRNYRVTKRVITTGEELNWGVAVVDGLEAGEMVAANAAAVREEGLAIPQKE